LGLLAVVAAASSARAASGGVASSPWLVLALLAPLVALVVLLALGGSVAIAYASLGVRARDRARRRRSGGIRDAARRDRREQLASVARRIPLPPDEFVSL
jgi:alpha-beta hydrolase superfamily lysophospholipase